MSTIVSRAPVSEISVDEAYAFCRAITHKHGANFSVGFRFLPPEKQRAVYASYAFCRWADDIADDGGPNVAERLDDWQQTLDDCYAGRATHPITVALGDAIRRFPIPQEAFAGLIEGCRQDVVKSRYETFDELLQYCDLVATTIAHISLAIFGYRSPAALDHGRNLATALQLTNITRDIGDDLERDRIYIPLEEMKRFGVSEEQLRAREQTPAMKALVEFQLQRAFSYFRAAQPLLGELSFDARFPTLLMGSIYSEVLKKIERDPFAPLHRRVSLSKAKKIATVLGRFVRQRFV